MRVTEQTLRTTIGQLATRARCRGGCGSQTDVTDGNESSNCRGTA